MPEITIRPLAPDDAMPYDLLLLADPSRELVDSYLADAAVFLAETGDRIVGVLVLSPLTDALVEVKNVAVEPALQGQGIGRALIQHAIGIAGRKGFKTICIGTANSSIGQLHLYQKLGFEVSRIKEDFFIRNYPEPIYENGIQARHMIVLAKPL